MPWQHQISLFFFYPPPRRFFFIIHLIWQVRAHPNLKVALLRENSFFRSAIETHKHTYAMPYMWMISINLFACLNRFQHYLIIADHCTKSQQIHTEKERKRMRESPQWKKLTEQQKWYQWKIGIHTMHSCTLHTPNIVSHMCKFISHPFFICVFIFSVAVRQTDGEKRKICANCFY